MKNKYVWVEIDPIEELPIRILGGFSDTLELEATSVKYMLRSAAVGYIRLQVIARAIRDKLIRCEFCGAVVTPQTGEMHEVVPKGDGGEVSLDNCRFICNECHTGAKDSEHGERRFQSSKIKEIE